MGTLFGLMICWIIISIFIAHVLPPLLTLIGHAFIFAIRVLAIAAAYSGKTLYRAAVYTTRVLTHWLYTFSLFVRFFCEELFADEVDDIPEEAEHAPDPLAEARALLVLPSDYDMQILKTAYRQAMKTAHPDKGGSEEEAKAVNAAYELLHAALA